MSFSLRVIVRIVCVTNMSGGRLRFAHFWSLRFGSFFYPCRRAVNFSPSIFFGSWRSSSTCLSHFTCSLHLSFSCVRVIALSSANFIRLNFAMSTRVINRKWSSFVVFDVEILSAWTVHDRGKRLREWARARVYVMYNKSKYLQSGFDEATEWSTSWWLDENEWPLHLHMSQWFCLRWAKTQKKPASERNEFATTTNVRCGASIEYAHE